MKSLSPVGDPVVMPYTPAVDGLGVVGVSAATSGAIVYRVGVTGAGQRRLVWFDRAGNEVSRVEGGEGGGSFALSADGQRLALYRAATGNGDLWMLDLRRGAASRFTSETTSEFHPLFSADGGHLIYQRYFSERSAFDIYWRPVSAAGAEEVLVADARGKIPTDVSRDGRLLLYKTGGTETETWDIWALPLTGERKPFSVLSTPFDERDGQFSPDGAWMLYQSNESGQFEVYLQPFGRAGERLQVSVGGGAQPRWRPDGLEIFYVAFDGRLMAVPVQPGLGEGSPQLGRPVPLFVTNIGPAVQPVSRQQYVVSADGQRFLMSTIDAANASTPLEVVLNFNPTASR